MSQPELVARLREARPAVPSELRGRVRLIAAAAPTSRHPWMTRRRALLVLVPVAAAIAAVVVLVPSGGKRTAPVAIERIAPAAAPPAAAKHAFSLAPAVGAAASDAAVPAPSPNRVQRYSASLELRERTATALAEASKQATQIATSLAGYPLRLNVHTGTSPSYADLVYRIPRVHVQAAVRRFTSLGAIVNEDVSIEDLQGQVNGTNDVIARLLRQLAVLYKQPRTTDVQRQVAALTAHVQRLQRAQAATLRAAHYATVEVRMTAPTRAAPRARHEHGPLHGLGIALHWLWIGAIYALALVAPLVVVVVAFWLTVRALRRRREDELLSRS
jgi:hypothetical protein